MAILSQVKFNFYRLLELISLSVPADFAVGLMGGNGYDSNPEIVTGTDPFSNVPGKPSPQKQAPHLA